METLIHKSKYLSSWYIRGLDGSMVVGKTSNGGSHSQTLSSTDKEPLASLSKNVSEINFSNLFKQLSFENIPLEENLNHNYMTFKISLEIFQHGINAPFLIQSNTSLGHIFAPIVLNNTSNFPGVYEKKRSKNNRSSKLKSYYRKHLTQSIQQQQKTHQNRIKNKNSIELSNMQNFGFVSLFGMK